MSDAYEISEEAAADLDEIAFYLNERQPDVGFRFLFAAQEAFE